jgi:mannose-6-phosphate isomerase
VTSQQLRDAITDATIETLVTWQSVSTGDVIYVPSGTIHAIGAGLVIAEIQQRSDATFRIFDYGRGRDLHIDQALAVAAKAPTDFQTHPDQLTSERTVLVTCPHFVLEKFDLLPNSAWRMRMERETWILGINGSARIGAIDIARGEAVFAQSENLNIDASSSGFTGLVAYTGDSSLRHLMQRRDRNVSGGTSVTSPKPPADIASGRK